MTGDGLGGLALPTMEPDLLLALLGLVALVVFARILKGGVVQLSRRSSSISITHRSRTHCPLRPTRERQERRHWNQCRLRHLLRR
jgi:hypothetical protein